MEEFFKILSTIGLSSVKHMFGGVVAAGYGYSYLEAFLYTAIGGLIGVAFFIFLSKSVNKFFHFIFPKKKKKKKSFTRMTRFIVRVKQRFGLVGIAFITPWVLTIPVGTMLACGIYGNKRKVFVYQAVSIIFWSLIGGGLSQPISLLIHG